jgi:hypothetical protein
MRNGQFRSATLMRNEVSPRASVAQFGATQQIVTEKLLREDHRTRRIAGL